MLRKIQHLHFVGIGGSALGPQFVADALGGPDDALTPHFLDNTDPDGIDPYDINPIGWDAVRDITLTFDACTLRWRGGWSLTQRITAL